MPKTERPKRQTPIQPKPCWSFIITYYGDREQSMFEVDCAIEEVVHIIKQEAGDDTKSIRLVSLACHNEQEGCKLPAATLSPSQLKLHAPCRTRTVRAGVCGHEGDCARAAARKAKLAKSVAAPRIFPLFFARASAGADDAQK